MVGLEAAGDAEMEAGSSGAASNGNGAPHQLTESEERELTADAGAEAGYEGMYHSSQGFYSTLFRQL